MITLTPQDDLAAIRGRATLPLWPDTGQLLGLGRNSTYEAARRGEIPTLRMGRNIRVPVPRLLAMLGLDVSDHTPAA